jgi:hypothetical protein
VVVPGITVSKQVQDPATGAWVEAATVDEGDPVAFRIVVTNSGEVALGTIAVDDPEVADCDASFVDELAPGASFAAYTCELSSASADFTNTAIATGTPVDGQGAPIGAPVEHDDTAAVTVVPLPTEVDLSLDKEMESYDPESGMAHWTFTVANNGPAVAQPEIVVTDDLPDGLDYTEADGDGWACNLEDRLLRCKYGSALAVGESTGFWLDTVVTATDEPIVNTAAVGGPDAETDLDNNTDDAELAVDGEPVGPGDPGEPLARTGSEALRTIAIALGLIGAGTAALVASRRRLAQTP